MDVATGSLGQGLSVAAGMAYVGKYIDKAKYIFLVLYFKVLLIMFSLNQFLRRVKVKNGSKCK